MATIHHRNIHPDIFVEFILCRKTFEYCKNDKDYRVGDILCLYEWDESRNLSTGVMYGYDITYILYGPDEGVPEGYCILALRMIAVDDAEPYED